MSRKAGNDPNYQWVLMDKSQDPPVPVLGLRDIELPSVTSIIKSTLAAPQLVSWAYRATVEGVELLGEHFPLTQALKDHDLDGLLELNRLRPEDIRDERAEEGNAAHRYLELSAAPDGEEHYFLASPYITAVKKWWEKNEPTVDSAEQVVVSLKYGYAGTLDLSWYPKLVPGLWITDLKTRKREARSGYSSDHIQLDGLRTAFEEQTGIPVAGTSVLIARDDGTYIEDASHPAYRGSFLKIKAVYDQLKEVPWGS